MTRLRRQQVGYLQEIPLILLVGGILFAVLLPQLPPWGAKLIAVVFALLLTAGLYYMIVIPGWQPGNPPRLRFPFNLIFFILVVGMIGTVTIYYLLNG